MAETLPLFDTHSNVVDFARYRAENPTHREARTLVDRTPRPVSARAAAHRWLMLRHIASQARAVGNARD